MDKIKSYILEFIWSGKNVSDFEQWLYEQNSIDFEDLIGEENYIELISFDFKRKTTDQLKQLLKEVLPENLIKNFEIEFNNRRTAIKGTCIKTRAWNPWAKEMQDWDLELNKEYEFLIVSNGMKDDSYSPTVNYVDKSDYFRPSGFIPAELFKIDTTTIPDEYHKIETDQCNELIELKDFSDQYYIPVKYSFWEDFYDDEEKAVDLYYDTIEKIGIKNVW